MNRKYSTFLAACGLTMMVCCVAARAQDTSRVPDTNAQAVSAVDTSVHADAEDGAKVQPLAARQPNKEAKPYSKWGFHPSNPTPATQFGPGRPASPGLTGPSNTGGRLTFGSPAGKAETETSDRTEDSGAVAAKGRNPGKPGQPADMFSGLSADRLHKGSTGSELFAPQAESTAAQPASPGLSSPSREKLFGGGSTSMPNPFPRATYSYNRSEAKIKSRKAGALKPGEKTPSSGVGVASGDQRKKPESMLTSKPN
jgi:hypothetical protein